jgi:phosphotriesterase-related protein
MRCLASLLEQGWQNQIVLGQDVFLKVHLHELVGNEYEHLPARVLPRLEQYGVPEQVVEQMMVANPRRHLTCYPPSQPGPGPAAAIPPPRVTS